MLFGIICYFWNWKIELKAILKLQSIFKMKIQFFIRFWKKKKNKNNEKSFFLPNNENDKKE